MTGPIKEFIYGEAQKLNSWARSMAESLILNFKWSSSFKIFCLWWNWINYVFDMFKDNLLTASQSEILDNSSFTLSAIQVVFCLITEVQVYMELIIVVSAAYKIKVNLGLTTLISFIYTEKGKD